MTKRVLCYALCAVMILLCGCKGDTQAGIVIGEGTGRFPLYEAGETDPIQVTYADEFTSADSSIQFIWNINSMVNPDRGRKVKFDFHELTAEDGRQAAEALFGDAVLYEKTADDHWTKSELRAALDEWKTWKDPTWLEAFHGRSMTNEEIAQWQAVIQKHIDKYHVKLSELIETEKRSLCGWSFHAEGYYLGMDDFPDDTPNYEIRAVTEQNGIPYELTVRTNSAKGRTMNALVTEIAPKSSPYNLAKDVITQRLTESAGVTQTQLDAAAAKAEKMLDSMGLGDWEIENCFANQLDNQGKHWQIKLKAVPAFPGVQYTERLRLCLLDCLRAHDETMAVPRADIYMTPDGTLLWLSVESPTDVTVLPMEGQTTLSFDELFRCGRNAMRGMTLSKGHDNYTKRTESGCEININEIVYSWSRVWEEEDWVFIPSLTFVGPLHNGQRWEYMTISALDGSVL